MGRRSKLARLGWTSTKVVMAMKLPPLEWLMVFSAAISYTIIDLAVALSFPLVYLTIWCVDAMALATTGKVCYGIHTNRSGPKRFLRHNLHVLEVFGSKFFPGVVVSLLWGYVHHQTVPMSHRRAFYTAWAECYSSNLDEVEEDLESFTSLAEFFSRKVNISGRQVFGLRTSVDTKSSIFAPADGALVDLPPSVIQVSTLTQLLMLPPTEAQRLEGSKLCTFAVHIGPGDYHRFHSPTAMLVHSIRHSPWYCPRFPITQVLGDLPFSLVFGNRRTAMIGRWRYGFAAVAAVGAFNVGKVVLTHPQLPLEDDPQGPSAAIGAGEELGYFTFGSMMVVVLEMPPSSPDDDIEALRSKEGVRVGQQLLRVTE